jgi:hypothetical protein
MDPLAFQAGMLEARDPMISIFEKQDGMIGQYKQDLNVWKIGFNAGLEGQAPPIPPDVKRLAFLAGVLDGLRTYNLMERWKSTPLRGNPQEKYRAWGKRR